MFFFIIKFEILLLAKNEEIASLFAFEFLNMALPRLITRDVSLIDLMYTYMVNLFKKLRLKVK